MQVPSKIYPNPIENALNFLLKFIDILPKCNPTPLKPIGNPSQSHCECIDVHCNAFAIHPMHFGGSHIPSTRPSSVGCVISTRQPRNPWAPSPMSGMGTSVHHPNFQTFKLSFSAPPRRGPLSHQK